MSHHFEKLPIALDVTYLEPNVTQEMIAARQPLVETVDAELRSGRCRGSGFTGWLKPEEITTDSERTRLKETAVRLKNETDVLLVIGIGGSYLGARAVIEALAIDPDRIVYAGQNISAHYMARLRDQLYGKRVAINVISKSGTTTEPAIAFRVLKDLAGIDSRSRIVVTTDARKGALRRLAQKEGYEAFVVPDNVGGRYSVLSAVGLFPIAYAGIDIDNLINGANDCAKLCAQNNNPLENPAYFYAVARNLLYKQGFSIEILASFEPRLHYFAEWWKQLFGESEGKENMALYPASVDFTTDLHSMGQYIQEGRRILTETFLIIDEGEPALKIPPGDDADELGYLTGKEVRYVNRKAYEATARAHRDGGVPNLSIILKNLSPYSMGVLIYFFEIACAASGLMLGVNPFDQPGVEAYKKVMFQLLGKPGFEKSDSTAYEPRYVNF